MIFQHTFQNRETFACLLLIASVSVAAQVNAEVFELRTYTVHDGKLDDLNKRFRDHTVALFKKHGMESVGYWVPTDQPLSENTLIYVLRHESREAAKKSWSAFIGDPDWKKAFQESRKAGPIVKKVDSVFMNQTAYNPKFETGETEKGVVFELRTYKTNAGKLTNLDSRFADHTIGLFKRHGMQSVAYWHPADEPAAKDTLIYILKHKSRDAAKESWKNFIQDPDWKKVARESQKAGPILKERPGSIYMNATDYSAIK